MLKCVNAISAAHTARGLADPTFGPMSAELNRLSGIGVPRSWKKEHWALFKALPYQLQVYVIERDRQVEKALRQAMNETADLRHKLADLKEKEAA